MGLPGQEPQVRAPDHRLSQLPDASSTRHPMNLRSGQQKEEGLGVYDAITINNREPLPIVYW